MQLARQQFGGLVMPYVVVRRAEDQAKGGFFKGKGAFSKVSRKEVE